MDGILNVLKPRGPTSHDVVARVRRVVGQKRVGHTGTLDPMAEGVLVLCLGRATRLAQFLTRASKEYRATVVLGMTTDTQDAVGKVVEERDASSVTAERLAEAIRVFTGEIEQVPPMISAVKHEGKRLYDLARRGEVVERKPRTVTVHSIEIIGFSPGKRAAADITVNCSSGTYIRTLCADIGDRLECGAHMGSLVRTRVGSLSADDAVDLDTLEAAALDGRIEGYLIDPSEAISDLPDALVRADQRNAAAHGSEATCKTDAQNGDVVRIVADDGQLIGVGAVGVRAGETTVKPKIVLVDPETR